jgi:hypothetical protein
MRRAHTVWIWKDYEGTPRYVGIGQYAIRHPAIDKFEARFDDSSDLGKWLQLLDEEPERQTYGPGVVGRKAAVAMAMGLRAKYADTLFGQRDPKTYKGGPPARGVYHFCASDLEKSTVYASVREAARDVGKNPSSVTRWCQNPKNLQWGYVCEDI